MTNTESEVATAARQRAAKGAAPELVDPDSASPASRTVAALHVVLPALVVVLATALALHRLDDFDTWWHLAAGRWIAVHRSLPATDVLSFMMADQLWINNQWLFEVVLYGLHQLGGAQLLVVAAAALFGLAIVLLIRNLQPVGPLGAALFALWVVVICAERFAIRPEMVSFVLLESLIWFWASARRSEGRYAWLLPLLMLLWANSHTLFIVGSFIVGSHLAAMVAGRLRLVPAGWRESVAYSPPAQARVLAAGAAALLAPLLNPYLLRGALYPLGQFSLIHSSSPAYQAIGEFQSPFSGYVPTLSIWAYRALFVFSVAVVGLTAVGTAWSTQRRRGGEGQRPDSPGSQPRNDSGQPEHGAAAGVNSPDSAESFDLGGLLVFCGLAYLSLLVRRNTALFALGTAPFVGQCLLVLAARMPAAVRRRGAECVTTVAVAAVPVLLVAVWWVASNGFYRWNGEAHEFGTGILETNFPIRAAAFIKELELPPKLYNDETPGGYLAWAEPVPGGIYIDGRLGLDNTQLFSDYLAALGDPQRWQAEADRAGIQTVLLFHHWANRYPLILWLDRNPGWQMVYVDEVAAVFVRSAGNEALIQRARARFETESAKTFAELAALEPSWQWPAGHVEAFLCYADVLRLLGYPEVVTQVYSQLLQIELPPRREAEVRVFLAYDRLAKGDPAAARAHLQLAERADPANPALAGLRARLQQ